MHYYYSIPFFFLITVAMARQHYHRCTDKFYLLAQSKNLSHCHRLPTQGAELGWSAPLSKNSHHVFQVVFGAPLEGEKGWLAWGVNPGPKPQMVNTRAAIGIKDPSLPLHCKTYSLTLQTRSECSPLRASALEEINCLGFEYDKTTHYYYFTATLNLSSADYNISKLNIVWQIGSDVDADMPKKHVANLKNIDSVETINLISGQSSDLALIKINLRQVHGIMNIIGWGTLLPVGVIIARFFSKFPFKIESGWYYAHVCCQSIGFTIGGIGWGIGIWLAHTSPHHIFLTHYVLGIIIFAFATLQTLAIRFKPGKADDFRKVWNIYHHFVGYSLLALVFANIFQGIRILKPDNKNTWRLAVIGILTTLGLTTLILEAYTWKKFIDGKKKKKEDDKKKSSQPAASKNGDQPGSQKHEGSSSIGEHQLGSDKNGDGSMHKDQPGSHKDESGLQEHQRGVQPRVPPRNSLATTPSRQRSQLGKNTNI